MNQYRPQLIAPGFASRRWVALATGILLAGLLAVTTQAQIRPRPGATGPTAGTGTTGTPGTPSTPGPRPGQGGPGAGPGAFPGGPRPGGALPFLGELNLTDAQKDQIKSIGERSREESKPIAEELRKIQPKKQALIYTGTFDEAAALVLVDQELALQKALTLNQMATQHAVYNVLTAEQKAKLAELIAKRKEMGPPRPTPPQGGSLPWGGFPRRP
jgi:Spy/CpxP family protein refolding chaperone